MRTSWVLWRRCLSYYFEIAAALFESLGQNHPFHNANKWTAFTALVVLLLFNGLHFKMDARKPKILQWIWFTINSIVNKRLRSLKLTAPRFSNHKSKPYSSVPFFHWAMSVISDKDTPAQLYKIRNSACVFFEIGPCRTVSTFRIAFAA